MPLNIQIDTDNPEALLEDLSAARGKKTEIPGEATIEFKPSHETYAIDSVTTVAAQVVASWLYDKIKNYATAVTVETHRMVKIECTEVTRIIETEIEKTKVSKR
jgi:hypothetical protein